MGYTTDFEGEFNLDKPLTKLQSLYIQAFARSRRMTRDVEKLTRDYLTESVDLPLGKEGEFFVGTLPKEIPEWSPTNTYLFNKKFKSQIFTLLCIQKFHMNNIDKNIFYKIVTFISQDTTSKPRLDILNLENHENIKLFDFHDRQNCLGVIDSNQPPSTQPSLWCHWTVGDDNQSIIWDGGEKFYHYFEWLQYIVKNFIKPWGYILSGKVKYNGEDYRDTGKIIIKNNEVSIVHDEFSSDDENVTSDEN